MDKIDPYIIVAWPTVDLKLADQTARKWKEQGYHTAVLINGSDYITTDYIDYTMPIEEWRGFPHAANQLTHFSYDIIVIAGDDMYPDQNKSAAEIGSEFIDYFRGTYGVMQPTGDEYGCIDIAAVSPWIGREYVVKNDYQPYCEEYYHYYCDADLQANAIKQGVFLQRKDISQYHDHWSRKDQQRPAYLAKAKEQHAIDKATYERRHGKIV